MTWSETFQDHIHRALGDAAQQKAATALGVSPSTVHYWCRGAVPRLTTRHRIEAWSSGAVPALAADVASSPDLDADESGPNAIPSDADIARVAGKAG